MYQLKRICFLHTGHDQVVYDRKQSRWMYRINAFWKYNVVVIHRQLKGLYENWFHINIIPMKSIKREPLLLLTHIH